jgi:hypothetical protein
MKRFTVLAFVAAALLAIVPATALAGGRGDNYKHPIAVSSTPYSNVHHSNRRATQQDGEPGVGCAQGTIYHSIWYTFTPQSTANYILDTEGSDFSASLGGNDTVLAVLTYNGTTWNALYCDDDAGTGNLSYLNVQLTGGTTYYFDVGSYGSDYYGHLVFNLTTP